MHSLDNMSKNCLDVNAVALFPKSTGCVTLDTGAPVPQVNLSEYRIQENTRDSLNIYFIALVVKIKRKVSDFFVMRKENYCCRLSGHDGVQQESPYYFGHCTQMNFS